MTQSAESDGPEYDRIEIDLGDGRIVTAHVPPAIVMAAFRRVKACVEDGVPAAAGDILLTSVWLDKQESKYPTDEAWR